MGADQSVFEEAQKFESKKDFWAAADSYIKVIKSNPKLAAAHNNLGLLYANQLDKPEEAEKEFRLALEIKPNYTSANCNLALLLSTKFGKYEEAFKYLKAAEQHSINDADIHIGMGRLLGEFMDKPKDAVYHFKKAITLNPLSTEAHYRFAQFYERRQALSEAASEFRKAMELNPNFPGLRTGWAFFLTSRLRKHDDAVAQYKLALEEDPNDFIAHSNLAFLLSKVFSKHEESIPHFIKALELNPKDSKTHHNYGYVLATYLNKPDEALAHYRQSLALFPNYANAHYNMGMLLMDHFKSPREAFFHFQKVVTLKPHYANAHYQIGVILEKEFNKKQEAIIHYRKALAIDGKHEKAQQSLSTSLNSADALAILAAINAETPVSFKSPGSSASFNLNDSIALKAALVASARPAPLAKSNSANGLASTPIITPNSAPLSGGSGDATLHAHAASIDNAIVEGSTSEAHDPEDSLLPIGRTRNESMRLALSINVAKDSTESPAPVIPEVMSPATIAAQIMHFSSTKKRLSPTSLERCESAQAEAVEASAGKALPDPEALPNVEPLSLGICYRI